MNKIVTTNMIDFSKVCKEMTREEFLNEIKRPMAGKLNTSSNCPDSYGLDTIKDYHPCIDCEQCWRNAVRGFIFKDESDKSSRNIQITFDNGITLFHNGVELSKFVSNDELVEYLSKLLKWLD